ncbi:MAG: NADH-quinone oxidoreductase subunit A, partial [Alphaproteobacteria bacterium HGW-Alphaproteobacteria-15]
MVDLSQYLPILLFVLVAFGLSLLFVVAPMAVSRLTGTHNPDAEKLS